MEPPGVEQLAGVGRPRHRRGPAAAVGVLGVLPLGRDAVLEEVVRRAGLQLAGRLDVVVQAAGGRGEGGERTRRTSGAAARERGGSAAAAAVATAPAARQPREAGAEERAFGGGVAVDRGRGTRRAAQKPRSRPPPPVPGLRWAPLTTRSPPLCRRSTRGAAPARTCSCSASATGCRTRASSGTPGSGAG